MINLTELMRGNFQSLLIGATMSFDTTTYRMSDNSVYCSGVITHAKAKNSEGIPETQVAMSVLNTESYVPTVGKHKGEKVLFSQALNTLSGPDVFYRYGFFAEAKSKRIVVEAMEAFALAMINHGCTRGNDS